MQLNDAPGSERQGEDRSEAGLPLAAARRALTDEVQRAAKSPYWPALAAALYSLAFIPRGSYAVGNPVLHALRAAPASPLICGLFFAWLYRRELSRQTAAALSPAVAALAGALLAPVFHIVFVASPHSLGPLFLRAEERLWTRFGLQPLMEALAIPLGGWPFLPGGDPLPLRWLSMAGEELFFRGVVFGLIRAKGGGFWKAGVISALAFALWHGNPSLVPYYFVWGLAVAAVYERTGSFWAPVALHLGYNGLLAMTPSAPR